MSHVHRPSRHGQSFAGLLVLLLIVTLMTALAAPRMDLSRFRSDAVARQASSVFAGAARSARRARRDVLVRVDSAGRRLGTLIDQNGNGTRDGREVEEWVELDRAAVILDPPMLLPVRGRRGGTVSVRPASRERVTFQRYGGAKGDLILYLTSDPGQPSAWRAGHGTGRRGLIQVWRFDGTRWTRART